MPNYAFQVLWRWGVSQAMARDIALCMVGDAVKGSRKLIYLVYREGLGSVFRSQVADPAGFVALEGWPVNIWVFAALGELIRPACRRRWAKVSEGIRAPVVRLPSPPSRWRWAWNESRVLSAAVRREIQGTQRIVFHCRGAFAAGMALRMRARYPQIRVVFQMSGLLHEEAVLDAPRPWPPKLQEQHDWLRQTMIDACRGADAVICVSGAMAGYATRYLEAEPKRVRVIPCCTDPARFRPARESRERIRARLGLQHKFVVAYCGSAAVWEAPVKNLDAFKKIRAVEPKSHALILTPNPSAFRRMAKDAGLDEAALTLLHVPYNDLPMYLGAADIALLMRERSIVNATASPVKLAEYMAAGLPVVMSDGIGDLSDAVSQNRLGCVLTDGDPGERLSVFIGEVRRETGNLRERIVSWCEQNLSWSVHLPALVHLYESLFEQSKEPGC